MRKFEVISHTADIGITAFGKDLPEVFANAAFGMFSLMNDLDKVKAKETIEVSVSSDDREGLLIAWLNELLSVFGIRKIIPSQFRILKMDDFSLSAKIRGEKYDGKKHVLETEIKAATYHELKIEKKTQNS